MKFIINILCGSRTGKTPIYSIVLSILKIKKENIQYIQKYAKNLVW